MSEEMNSRVGKDKKRGGRQGEKMEMRKAFGLLMEKADEISKLRTLPPDKRNYKLWCAEVSNILELTFSITSREYDNFVKAVSSDYLVSTEEEKREKYNKELDAYEIALDSALHKCALIADETPKDKSEQPPTIIGSPPKSFIAHGGQSPILDKLKNFLIALGIEPVVVEEQASEHRSVGDNVDYYARQADFAIILATKGDIDGKTGGFIPRGNVLIEIGKSQEIFKDKIIYLLQAGTKFPTNISEKVWGRFTTERMDDAFIKIARELHKFGILHAIKPPPKEHTLDHQTS